MRCSLGLLLVIAVSCTPGAQRASQSSVPKPSTVSPTESQEPRLTILEHIGYSYDDAGEYCLAFDGDGAASDPDGIGGKVALQQAYGSIETKIMPDGREALCMLGAHIGSKECTFKEGHWVHRLVKADGSNVRLPNDLRSYRVHDREIDAWLWQSAEFGFPYEHIGTHFDEFCSPDQ